ncbi:hypothetical protein BGZ54_009114, partial [Gamsiella multidivaricata]
SEPAAVDGDGRPGGGPSPRSATLGPDGGPIYEWSEYTLGNLDLNIWEEQRLQQAASASSSGTPSGQGTTATETVGGGRGRRSSITQAGVIQSTEYQIQQELARPGPITPLSQMQPVRNVFSSALGTSSLFSTMAVGSTTTPQEGSQPGESYMAQFTRRVLGLTGTTGPQNARTGMGMTAAALAEEARQLVHTVGHVVMASKKQYKFMLSKGVHYIGDQDFIMKYTMVSDQENENPYQLRMKVDYIRVSWKFVTSGLPLPIKPRQVGAVATRRMEEDPIALEDPFPQERIGRIYAERFNRLASEVRRRGVSRHLRGELAMNGFDVSVLPRDFISVNLRAGPVLEWITRTDCKDHDTKDGELRRTGVLLKEQRLEGANRVVGETDDNDCSDMEWEDLAPGSKADKEKGKAAAAAEKGPDTMVEADEAEDEAALEQLLGLLKQNMGLLNARNILEEMLAHEGFSRELIWKYGIVRRELMGPVPEITQARLLLKKVTDSEAASQDSTAIPLFPTAL